MEIINCLVSENSLNDLLKNLYQIKIKDGIPYFELFRTLNNFSAKDFIGYPYKGYLYFIGDFEEYKDKLEEFTKGFPQRAFLDLDIKEHNTILTYIFYRGFIKKLKNIGFIPLKKVHKRRRVLPSLKLGNLIEKIGENSYVCYGLKFYSKILKEKQKMLLFIDIYAPFCCKFGNLFFPVKVPWELWEKYKRKAALPPKERYKKLNIIVDLLKEKYRKINVEFPNDVKLIFSPNFSEINNEIFSEDIIEEPLLKFRDGYSRNPIVGIRKYKPFSFLENFETNLYLLVDKRIESNKVERLIEYLKDGCEDRYGKYKGYNITFGSEIEIKETRKVQINNVRDIVNNIPFEIKSNSNNNMILVVIIKDDIAPKGTKEGTKFYKELKRFCLKNNIRCQLIRESTLDKLEKDGKTKILYNLSSSLYAKAGGTPWKLKEKIAPDGSIIIGIAFSVNHKVKKIRAGILYLYDKWGEYLTCKIRKINIPIVSGYFIPYDTMKSLLEEIKADFPWVKYIIFHKSYPYHDEEIEATRESLGKEIGYLLLHIKTTTCIRVFNGYNENFTPLRGTIIRINNLDNSFILFTTGNVHDDNKIRQRLDIFGTPRPLEIVIKENTIENFEIKDIARQILSLTKLDLNTCNLEVREPITTKYARKSAIFLPIENYDENANIIIKDIRDIL